MDLINLVEQSFRNEKAAQFPQFKAGDTVTVSYKIKEGDKERIQKFKGVVIQIKGATPFTRTFIEQTALEDRDSISWLRKQICLSSSIAKIMSPSRGKIEQLCLQCP